MSPTSGNGDLGPLLKQAKSAARLVHRLFTVSAIAFGAAILTWGGRLDRTDQLAAWAFIGVGVGAIILFPLLKQKIDQYLVGLIKQDVPESDPESPSP